MGVWSQKLYPSKCRPHIPIQLLYIQKVYLCRLATIHNVADRRQTYKGTVIGHLCSSTGGLKTGLMLDHVANKKLKDTYVRSSVGTEDVRRSWCVPICHIWLQDLKTRKTVKNDNSVLRTWKLTYSCSPHIHLQTDEFIWKKHKHYTVNYTSLNFI